MKKASKGLDSRIYRYGKGTALPTMDASDITVPQTAPAVKPDAAIPSGGVTPGGTGAAQASGTSSQDGTTTAATSGTDTDQTAEASPELTPPRQQEPENGK